MEEAGKENDFFEVLVSSSHEDFEWRNRQIQGVTKFPRTCGFVRIDKLCLLIPEDDDINSEMNVDLDETNKELTANNKQLDLEVWSVSEIDKRIIELYFIQKRRPAIISKLTKQPKSKIYTIVESIKRMVMKSLKERELRIFSKRCLTGEVKEVIRSYWKQKENRYFTVDDVRRYVDACFKQNGVVSYSTVRRFMIKSLEMGYKRVSTRPSVVLKLDFIDKQKAFWKFYRMCRQWNIKNNTDRRIYGWKRDICQHGLE